METINLSSLANANAALRGGDFATAIVLYDEALDQVGEPLRPYIRFNRDLASRRLAKAVKLEASSLIKPKSLDDYYFNLIKQGNFFDPAWYLAEYKDKYHITGNALAHYLDHGVALGTNPSPDFDTAYYLKTHRDVAASGMHPFLHYVCQGHKEERDAKLPAVEVSLDMYPVEVPQYVPRLAPDAPQVEKAARVIAFYLPQFHPIPENDAWWGKGFTEWTNVKPAKPQFEGHYQPHVPDDFLGYYDLRDTAVMHKQIELAKQYGIEGFCFYTYWFTGHRLLETPVDNYLADTTLDLPFCVCWANENWSRRWDGLDQDLLMVQHYSAEDDIAFIAHMSKYLLDPRYIRIHGKPLLLVYRPNLFPDARATVERWRAWCREHGIGEIYLTYPQSFECVDPAEYGFDAACEFPPNNSAPPSITHQMTPVVDDFQTAVYDWRIFIQRSENYQDPGYTLFRGTTPSWDNTARKKNKGTVFQNSSPKLFEKWLVNAFTDTLARHNSADKKIVFVNAWNEWAEGAHLEPDQRYGYAWLQAVHDAHQIALKKRPRLVIVSHDAHPHGAQILCLNFARYFKRQLHCEVDLIVLGEGRLISKYQEYANVHQLNLVNIEKPLLDALLSSLRKKGAQVAIVNTTVSGLLVPHLKKHGFSVVSLVHEMPGVLASYQLNEHAAQIATYADKVIFPAQQVQDGFEAFIGQTLAQAVIRPQGLYLRSLLRQGADKGTVSAEVRKELGLADNARIILCAGYADHRKGFDLFVRACIQVMQQLPETYALWVGHLDQTFVDQSMDVAVTAGLRDRFLFTGLVDQPQKYYLAADIYALTSREDPFPSVVMEALDALTPVIAFKNCGGFENLLSRDCGVLVPTENYGAFAVAMIDLLKNPQHAKALAENGRNIVEAEFSFRHYLFDLLDFSGHPMPRVSVVVPNYKYEKYIRQRLESVTKQTYPIFELIVLDDCSPDDSVVVINDFLKDCEIPHQLVINEQNSGSVFRQWQKGVEMARGDLVWIAEADDLAAPHFLEKLLPFFKDSGVVLAYTQSKQIDEDDHLLANDYLAYTNDVGNYWLQDYVVDGEEEIRRALCIKNTIPNVSGVVFRREQLLHALQVAKEDMMALKVAGDWMLYLQLAICGKVAYHSGSLNMHRRHVNSVTKVNNHFEEVIVVQKIATQMVRVSDDVNCKMKEYIKNLKEHFGLLNNKGVNNA